MIVYNNINVNKEYQKLSKNIEYGGILCGKKDNNENIIIKELIYLPSKQISDKNYIFNTNILHNNNYCKDNFLGIFHTHPKEEDKFPSGVDRKNSSELGYLGCVITNDIKCYDGWKDLMVINTKR